MSEYQLKTWFEFVYEKHQDTWKANQAVDLLDELRRPDLTEMVMHYFNESQRAIEFEQQNARAESDQRWQVLGVRAMEAIRAITAGDPREIAYTFFNMGQVLESLNHPTQNKQLALIEAYTEKQKSEFPLRVHNLKRDFLKKAVQEKALERWATDIDKDFRLTEMCKLVLPDARYIAGQIETEAPDKADTLKPWLREVYPEYAKKKGRPKKADLIM